MLRTSTRYHYYYSLPSPLSRYKPYANALCGACAAIASAGEKLATPVRVSAVELILTLAECAPALCRKNAAVTAQLAPALLELMCEPRDADDAGHAWAARPYAPPEKQYNAGAAAGAGAGGSGNGEDDDDDEADWEVENAAMALERLSAALGKSVLQSVLSLVGPNLASPDWRRRAAAVEALARAAEGATKQLKPHVSAIIAACCRCIADEHSPRVRHVGCSALGRICSLYAGDVQAKYHAQVVPVLVAALADADGRGGERTRGNAGAALCDFLSPDDCEPDHLEPYVEGLLKALSDALTRPGTSAGTQLQALTAVARVAQVVEADFSPYYSAFMPGIRGILAGGASGGDAAAAALRGRAMECAGLIGEAVGANAFRADAIDVMNLLLGEAAASSAVAEAHREMKDAYFENMAPAFVRIAAALGTEFAPYLQHVLPPLLEVGF